MGFGKSIIGSTLIIAIVLYAGCSAVNPQISPPPSHTPQKPSSSIQSNSNLSTDDNSSTSSTIAGGDEESDEETWEWSELSPSQRLNLSQTYLDSARKAIKQSQLSSAELALNQARRLLATLFIDSLENESQRYLQLVSLSVYLFEELIKLKGELPIESSLADLITTWEGEGDTVELKELLTPEEMILDTSNLAEIIGRKEPLPPVPLLVNPQVESAIHFFQTRGRKVYQRWLERAEIYQPIFQRILKEEGLPEELVYLAMIESGFNIMAYSYAHASGPWQFITSTARIFGLEVSWWYDERRDPIKSTYAACRYLRKLYYDFGDWYLAMAAYNCGEKKVQAHIDRYGTRDFWKLTRLPRQTRNYVPTFLAAWIIAQDPALFGFTPPQFRDPDPVDSVWVKDQVDLRVAAKIAGISYEELKRLNPFLLRWATPPDRDSCLLILPEGKGESFLGEWAKIPPTEKKVYTYHTVRKGETLGSIARRYGVSIRDITALAENRIRNINRLSVGQSIIIPVPPSPEPQSPQLATQANRSISRGDKAIPSSPPTPPSTAHQAQPVVPSPDRPLTHTVQRGESLFSIARRYGTTVEDLMRLNGLKDPHHLRAGALLKIGGEGSGEFAMGSEQEELTHIVRKGESPWSIARQYGINHRELMRANNIRSPQSLKPGARLVIPKG